MIKKWLITGDTHGSVANRINTALAHVDSYPPSETAMIILGDAGLNFYLNISERDKIEKRNTNNLGYRVYCVRGNHEERPENIPSMQLLYDEDVLGQVYYEPDYPNIRYFLDGGEYTIDGHSVLAIGGAYSVDKWLRLSLATANATWTGWFAGEQLTESEMVTILNSVTGKHYDFVFTHTCPLDWEPVDLFLGGIDQTTVDKTMEVWLNELKEKIDWTVWLFGHYHADRLERPGVEMFYKDVEDMGTIWERWNDNKPLDWWMTKSPNYWKEI